jgi:hypothetical protein
MRYQVPQFIEVEDKIFGPLTLKQFIYLAGGGGLCLAFFTLLPFYVFVFLAIPVMGFSLALAFYQVNDRPLITTIEHAFGFYTNSKLYLWKQRPPEAIQAPIEPEKASIVTVPHVSQSRLRDLAWSLNIKDKVNQ